MLAAVGKLESDHGRHTGPSTAGALGPMQFLPSTWARYRVDGNGDGRADIGDPADAIPAAARYLCDHGAGRDIRAAVYAYNHSHTYVTNVLAAADRYRQAAVTSAPSDEAGKVVAYARAQIGKPYVWGAEGPQAFDCSGLVYAAYRTAGITLPRTSYQQWRAGTRIRSGHEQPGDLVFFNSGPGTGPDHPGHVGIVTAPGQMIAAPRPGKTIHTGSYHRADRVGFVRPRVRP